MITDKPTGACKSCGTRPATVWWSDEGVVAAIHGFYSARCERCVVADQLAHARELAETIPKLERRLAELDGKG